LRRAIYGIAGMLCCGQLAGALPGVVDGASAEQLIAKNVTLQQSSGSEIPNGKRPFENHSIFAVAGLFAQAGRN